jgi:hypothetical protein
MTVAQGQMPFTQLPARGSKSNTEVKTDYLPGLASDEKKLRSGRL